jgi:S-adenosylmethionine decarboxylase
LLQADPGRDRLAPRQHRIKRMQLHAMDAWLRDVAVLTDAQALRTILNAGAQAGGATVVGEEFCEFPNGAVTGVLVLAQSHLSIHTWPEFALANIDLLSYGDLDGDIVLGTICELLDVALATTTCIPRAVA